MKKNDNEKFLENYEILKNTVQKLREADLSELDEIIDMVEQGNAAYKKCKSRIDAVKKAIEAQT